MEGRSLNIRLSVMGVVTVLLSLVVIFRLYDLQIVNGDSYYKQSEKKITRTVDVPASRGEILDRYGRKLVSNRLSYNVAFDSVIFPSDRKNEIILELIYLCREKGLEYTNTLPIMRVGNRYIFTNDETHLGRLNKFLTAMQWGEDLPADEVFDKLRAEYKIPEDLSDRDALELCGVRYELDLRTAKINLNISDYVFLSDVDTELIAVIKERDLPGVAITTETVRKYETVYAAHLLGRVGPLSPGEYEQLSSQGYALNDRLGKDGAEKAFEGWLRGKPGRRIEDLNTSGKVTSVMYSQQPEPGGNVVLTIDIKLQEAVEKSLAARIAEIKALGDAGSNLGASDVKGGAAVVIDVKTFAVLAMASCPSYNLSTFSADFAALNADEEMRPMLNRALTGTYEPGSTFKMVTTAAAMENGVIDRKTRITDYGIYMYYSPTYTPMCEIYMNTRGTHGTVSIVDALRVSCNYFFYEVGRLTGIEKLNEYARLFGLGEKTGIELEGESKGILAGPESREERDGIWLPGDTIAAAIGQSDNLFTPLQMATYIATIANHGVRRNVHILKSVKSYDYGGTIYSTESEIVSDAGLSEETLSAIFDGMLAVSKTGSASAVFSNYPINVASKTGTAQTSGAANGIFVAFAPYEDPEIAVAIVVEQAGKGSRIGVIARDIFDAYFRINDSFENIPGENDLLN